MKREREGNSRRKRKEGVKRQTSKLFYIQYCQDKLG